MVLLNKITKERINGENDTENGKKTTAKYPDVLDVAATTKILNLCKTRVNELIADGSIPAIRIGKKNFIAKERIIDYLCR